MLLSKSKAKCTFEQSIQIEVALSKDKVLILIRILAESLQFWR